MLQVYISVDSLTQFLERFLLWLDSNGITLNLMKSLFSKDRLQCFFSKEGIPDWLKLGETEKNHTPKNAINFFFKFFWKIYTKYSTLIYKYSAVTHPLREVLLKVVNFDWTETCNEAFRKLKFCMNSDTCLSYFDKSVYKVEFTILLQKMKNKKKIKQP